MSYIGVRTDFDPFSTSYSPVFRHVDRPSSAPSYSPSASRYPLTSSRPSLSTAARKAPKALPANPNPFSPPTVKPLRELPITADALSPPEQAQLAEIRQFLGGRSTTRELTLSNISPTFIDFMDNLAKKGDLEGWDGRYSYRDVDRLLIITFPTFIHESWAEIINGWRQLVPLPSSHYSTLPDGCSTTMPLCAGRKKTPDASFYERLNDTRGQTQAQKDIQVFPTVSFEAAFSERIDDAREAAAQTIATSMGNVLLVVILHIPYSSPSGGGRAPITNVQIEFWQGTKMTRLSKPYTGAMGFVPTNPPRDYVYTYRHESPASTSLVEFEISRTVLHDIDIANPGDGHLEFYYQHFFRRPNEERMDDVVYSIPLRFIAQIIQKRSEEQEVFDAFEEPKSVVEEDARQCGMLDEAFNCMDQYEKWLASRYIGRKGL